MSICKPIFVILLFAIPAIFPFSIPFLPNLSPKPSSSGSGSGSGGSSSGGSNIFDTLGSAGNVIQALSSGNILQAGLSALKLFGGLGNLKLPNPFQYIADGLKTLLNLFDPLHWINNTLYTFEPFLPSGIAKEASKTIDILLEIYKHALSIFDPVLPSTALSQAHQSEGVALTMLNDFLDNFGIGRKIGGNLTSILGLNAPNLGINVGQPVYPSYPDYDGAYYQQPYVEYYDY